MAVNLTTVTGNLETLIGDTPSIGRLWFRLTRPDWNADGNIFSPQYVEAVADPTTGAFSIDLQSTDDFEVGATYRAILKYFDIDGLNKEYELGAFAVGTGGPFELTDLLAVPVVEPIPADVLALVLAAQAAAEAAAAEAAAEAAAAAASAAQAALYDGPWLDDAAGVLADTTLTYTGGSPSSVVAGNYARTRAEGFSYLVAASGATDHHVITAGGVKLYVLPGADGFVTPEQFGKGGGVSDTAAVTAAFAASGRVRFRDDQTYTLTSAITKAANDVRVDFGRAKIVNSGVVGHLFVFGVTDDEPVYTGLVVSGGIFSQSNPAVAADQNYIRVAGTQQFSVTGFNLSNVSNGGVFVEAGCYDGFIEGEVYGASGNVLARAIWLNGSTASDFSADLVDTTSITRNATALPVYNIRRVFIGGKTRIVGVPYGVYAMNAIDCGVCSGAHIDISGPDAARCIAANNYCPGFVVSPGVILRSDRSSTGILVTQFSTGVVINGVIFRGSFGGNRDIYVQYLAEAKISNCVFETDGTQNIQVDMGGFAEVEGNTTRGGSAAERFIYATPIPAAIAGTGTIGNTATLVGGVVAKRNTIFGRIQGLNADCASFAAANGNLPGFTILSYDDNQHFDLDDASGGAQFPLYLQTGSAGVNITPVSFDGNRGLPRSASEKVTVSTTGSDFVMMRSGLQMAQFLVSVATAGGAITVTKEFGADYSLAVTRSGTNLVLSPRTKGALSGALVARVLGVCDAGGTIARTEILASGSNFSFKAFTDVPAAIDFSSTAGSFRVLVGANGNT